MADAVTRETTYHCSGPECTAHVQSMNRSPVRGWIETKERVDLVTVRDFCSWDCVMKFAAGMEPMDVL